MAKVIHWGKGTYDREDLDGTSNNVDEVTCHRCWHQIADYVGLSRDTPTGIIADRYKELCPNGYQETLRRY